MFSKNDVIENFSKASANYDSYAAVQTLCAKRLAHLVSAREAFSHVNSVLDIGTGSGSVIESLYKKNPNLIFTANDISNAMLNICKAKLIENNIRAKYWLADAEVADFNSQYDMVISNFCYQWFTDFKAAIRKLLPVSKRIFAFTMLLDGTFSEWQKAHLKLNFNSPLLSHYPSKAEVLEFLKKSGEHSLIYDKQCKYGIRFKSVRSFLAYLKRIGASSIAKNRYSVGQLKNLIRSLDGDPILMEYDVLFVVLVK